MNILIRLLTWRYLTRSSDTDSLSTMVIICILGIGIGSFSLTLVSAIARGFEHTLHQKMQGVHADIIIRGYGDELDVPAIQTILTTQFPQIIASAPSTIEHVIIKTSDDIAPIVSLIKAIDPLQEIHATRFTDMITSSMPITTPMEKQHTYLPDLLANNQILIGTSLATLLNVAVGDEIELLYTEAQNTTDTNNTTNQQSSSERSISLSSAKARIGGLFTTGIDECDSTLIVSSFDFLHTLFPQSGPTQLNLTLHPGSNEQQSIQQLTNRFKLEVLSWKSLYPALVSALTLEKYALMCIIALVLLVASMNTIALLLMQINAKRPDIALLKAMGTPDNTIERIFMCMGMTITMVAALPGVALAALISYLLNHYHLITLPDAYYITYLPAYLDATMLTLILTIICVISGATIAIATRKIRTIPISHVLRFEG